MSGSIAAVEARQKLGEILNQVALLRKEIVNFRFSSSTAERFGRFSGNYGA